MSLQQAFPGVGDVEAIEKSILASIRPRSGKCPGAKAKADVGGQVEDSFGRLGCVDSCRNVEPISRYNGWCKRSVHRVELGREVFGKCF